MERRELERQIVEKEWLMFQQVQGVNGRAACQDDWTTFLIMRLSQFEGWDTDVLESYFEDIVQAEAQERNLIMEKYAYMMEETDPVYFLSIKELLPEISEEKQLMAEKITSIYMEWEKEADIKYPNIRRHGRPAEGIGVDGTVSVRNYLSVNFILILQRHWHFLFCLLRKIQNTTVILLQCRRWYRHMAILL